MKSLMSHWAARSLAATLAASALLAATGCQTRGYQRAAATSGSLTTAANELESAKAQINQAVSALEQMVQRPTDDLRPLFTDYRRAVSDLENSVQSLERRSVEMEEHKQNYLATWDQRTGEMLNPQIRDQSLQRQQEVTQQFSDVQNSYTEARESFVPLMQDLRDIQRMLSVDLTAAGVEVARNLLPQIRDNAGDARQALTQLAEDFREVSTNLEPGTMQNATFAE